MSIIVNINGKECAHAAFLFSGGEVQVRLGEWQSNIDSFNIEAKIHNSNDLMELFMVTDAIRRRHNGKPIDLVLKYVPYARQDRVCAPGEAIGIAVLANLINSQMYRVVQMWDPHSDVTPALIDNSQVINQAAIIHRMLGVGRMDAHILKSILVSPDAGANKKVLEVQKQLMFKGVINADKKRDPASGEITGTIVHASNGYTADFLIVDDICDGGRTFIELAKVLKEHTSGKIRLYVTHGIFSKGLDVFDGLIDHIFVANLFDEEHAKHPLITAL